MRAACAVAALALSGCTYTLTLTSEVSGARVDGLRTGATSLPAEVTVPWGWWVRRPVTVSAPGHRPLELDLGYRTARAADYTLLNFFTPWRPPSGELAVMLVKEHGLSGTWTAEELGVAP